jgi:hypothetical protein
MAPISHPPAFYAKIAGICFVVRKYWSFQDWKKRKVHGKREGEASISNKAD